MSRAVWCAPSWSAPAPPPRLGVGAAAPRAVADGLARAQPGEKHEMPALERPQAGEGSPDTQQAGNRPTSYTPFAPLRAAWPSEGLLQLVLQQLLCPEDPAWKSAARFAEQQQQQQEQRCMRVLPSAAAAVPHASPPGTLAPDAETQCRPFDGATGNGGVGGSPGISSSWRRSSAAPAVGAPQLRSTVFYALCPAALLQPCQLFFRDLSSVYYAAGHGHHMAGPSTLQLRSLSGTVAVDSAVPGAAVAGAAALRPAPSIEAWARQLGASAIEIPQAACPSSPPAGQEPYLQQLREACGRLQRSLILSPPQLSYASGGLDERDPAVLTVYVIVPDDAPATCATCFTEVAAALAPLLQMDATAAAAEQLQTTIAGHRPSETAAALGATGAQQAHCSLLAGVEANQAAAAVASPFDAGGRYHGAAVATYKHCIAPSTPAQDGALLRMMRSRIRTIVVQLVPRSAVLDACGGAVAHIADHVHRKACWGGAQEAGSQSGPGAHPTQAASRGSTRDAAIEEGEVGEAAVEVDGVSTEQQPLLRPSAVAEARLLCAALFQH